MRYLVVEPVKYKGKRIEPGKSVDMPEAEGDPLVVSGILQADRKAGKKRDTGSEETKGGDTGTGETKGGETGTGETGTGNAET